jgi:RNA polymerase sigma-70 factor (family 1)
VLITFDRRGRYVQTDQTIFLLIEKIRSGDHRSFESLFDLYWKDLYKYALKVLESESEAEDIVQQIFCEIWECRETLHIQVSPKAYFFGILKKKILKTFRSEGIRQKHAMILKQMLFYKTGDSPLDSIIADDLLKVLQDHLLTLPKKEREVFILNQIEGYSIKEISEKLSTSEQTVRNQVSSASHKVHPVLVRLLS